MNEHLISKTVCPVATPPGRGLGPNSASVGVLNVGELCDDDPMIVMCGGNSSWQLERNN